MPVFFLIVAGLAVLAVVAEINQEPRQQCPLGAAMDHRGAQEGCHPACTPVPESATSSC